MRTKTLLCLAAVTAAGVATSMAQSNVYSLNVVGYYNIPAPANKYILIANQLNTTNNELNQILTGSAGVTDGSQIQLFGNGAIVGSASYDASIPGWDNGSPIFLNPGGGFYFKSPSATTITFVGEVRQGSLTNTLPNINLYVVRSSIVPQQTNLDGLGIVGDDGDQIQLFGNGAIVGAASYDASLPGWDSADPGGPTIIVGQAFFYKKPTNGTHSLWVRNFTVQ